MKRKHPFNLSSTRGGYRENAGRKSGWNHRETCTIRIPKTFASQLVELARRLDNGEKIDIDTESKLADNDTVTKSITIADATGKQLSLQVTKEPAIDIDTESKLVDNDTVTKSITIADATGKQLSLPVTKESAFDIDTESKLVDDDTVTSSESTIADFLIQQTYPLEKKPVWENDTKSNSTDNDLVTKSNWRLANANSYLSMPEFTEALLIAKTIIRAKKSARESIARLLSKLYSTQISATDL